MSEIDKLGEFYIGRRHDLSTGKTAPDPLIYDSKDLTTHAVCVGMTGSGKTGLCLSLLEEAALNGIPAIAIDPKGDLANLLLAFPKLQPSDFRPWIDESEAARKQMSPDEFAANQADTWRKGLAQWDEQPERIQRFCSAVDRVIYTPGSSAGIPITVLRSFNAPPAELVADADAYQDRITSAASGLLALLGIDADPVRSREHILLSNLFDTAWRSGKDLDLNQLIQEINRPPFDKIGAVAVESFFPARDRSKLVMSLNNLLASPSFASWLEGVPLDIKQMLYTPEGKPRLAIVSIAHLDDAQRVFFITILLNEVLAWIRTQPGTGSLRALLYMDEVFGYFPPIGSPPTKRPMLTLLKQARAFGLGIVLATQNPVDLDYKGLSNAGTWFLGRLQTERDKARVIEGLEGASTQAGASFNRQQMEKSLAALGNRVFLMNNVHREAPVVFHTRWALSYLCGPLTRNQIKTLMDPVRAKYVTAAPARNQSAPKPALAGGGAAAPAAATAASSTPRGQSNRPVLPGTIRELFAVTRTKVSDGHTLEYRPGLLGKGKVHFVRKANGIDVWRDCVALQPVQGPLDDDIWEGAILADEAPDTDSPEENARFADLPADLTRDKNYANFSRRLKDYLYRAESMTSWHCPLVEESSKPDEREDAFRARLGPLLDSRLSLERDKLEQAHAPKLASIDDRIKRAQTRLSTQRWQFLARLGTMLWVVVDAIMSAMGRGLPGRRRSLDPAIRSVATEGGQQSNAKAAVEIAMQERERIERQYQDALKQLETSYSPAGVQLESIQVKPNKGDVQAGDVSLVWLPWFIDANGNAEPAYQRPSSSSS